jgi:hypothetical protein
MPPQQLENAVLVLHRFIHPGRIAVLEFHPMGAVRLLAGDIGLLLLLAGGGFPARLVIAPRIDW